MSFHEAARQGNVEVIRQLVAANPEAVNDRDKHSRTPLHLSAWAGHLEVVKILCDAKADVGAAAQDDMGAIHFASQKGHIEVVRALLLAGGYVNARNRKGMTPLHFAVQGSHADLVSLLIKKGGNLEAENKAKKKPYDLIRDETLRSVMEDARIARDNRRAKGREKNKKHDSIREIGDANRPGNQTEAEGIHREGSNTGSVSAVDDKAFQRDGLAVESPPRIGETDRVEIYEDPDVPTGPKMKKAKVALSHLLDLDGESEVD